MSSLRLAADYLLYRKRAFKLHGVHSPFIFDLYHNVLMHDGHFPAYDRVETLRVAMLQDNRQLQVTDLGAGSKTLRQRQRKVKDIARSSAKTAKYGQLLFRLINYFQPQTIFDLGTSLGITTSYLGEARREAEIYTFEGCPNIAKVACENFSQLGLKQVQLIKGDLSDTLEEQLQQVAQLDFAFFDGNHRYTPTMKYFKTCLTKKHEHSVFVMDDIYWSGEMKRAWKEIKQHPQVMQTVDLFFVGLVFFRTTQPKEHFTLSF
ncbi:class I SAM-dependent methyltransferase [Pontibacter diazotrophicus]|uniref:Class I SAM-dependent methyltransferase n=1 Tax=Pontibacter diazotrophicus TaxID=1400979 RepID=A0A3D8LGP1_9BACT|nr:class I SAM-dependent methyltransferase [Pontibacter diazotrophicus]RDV16593.1 class I SAM-dependent methyltransferase [Pontibacter diazotrophicus]